MFTLYWEETYIEDDRTVKSISLQQPGYTASSLTLSYLEKGLFHA